MDLYVCFSVWFWMCLVWIAQALEYSQHESDRLLNICQLDHVTLECDIGHVIVLKSALYGRMEANHCIGSSHLGCFSDVLGWVDRWCSGRWKCFIDEGFQVHLENTNYDCPQYRDKYLQLSYQCIDVVEPMSPTCSDLELPAAILSATSGYISSHVTRETSCFRSPWVVVAPPDSSIVIDILDFSWTLNGQSCDRNYAHIFDIADETTTTLCRRNQRQHGPYIFDTTQIQIRIIPTPQGMEFLIRYAVVPRGSARIDRLLSAANHKTANTTVSAVVLVTLLLLRNCAE